MPRDRYRSLPADAIPSRRRGPALVALNAPINVSREGARERAIRIAPRLSYGRPGATSDYEGYWLRARARAREYTN
jgi:hypothetical protein